MRSEDVTYREKNDDNMEIIVSIRKVSASAYKAFKAQCIMRNKEMGEAVSELMRKAVMPKIIREQEEATKK